VSDHHAHRYQARCHWQGSTGAGYESYGRAHRGAVPPALSPIDLSADPAFRGDSQRCNPEQLLVLAAASCQLLSFLAVATRARVDVRNYDDEAEGVMPETAKPLRLTAIRLRPTITVGPGHSHERLAHLVEVAHRECYIANSVTCEITVEPTFRVLDYAFGDNEVARRRLGLLAEVFNPSSRSFLAEHAPRRAHLALDLGCGPGATTRLLAEATRAERTVGLDCSPTFVAAARAAHGGAGMEFAEHDVMRTPFPAAASAADVIFARFLLAHLPDLAGALSGWLAQLHPHGILAVEETEAIETGSPVFGHYLALAEKLVATRGATLFPGAALAELAESLPTRVLANRICQVDVPAGRAAELFGLNLAVWRCDPAVDEAPEALDRLADQLDALRQSGTGEHVSWSLRQLALALPDRGAG
jgi:organic hydroperoxide reductase OsmC/OhrA/SAM-dependent methyltransferase